MQVNDNVRELGGSPLVDFILELHDLDVEPSGAVWQQIVNLAQEEAAYYSDTGPWPTMADICGEGKDANMDDIDDIFGVFDGLPKVNLSDFDFSKQYDPWKLEDAGPEAPTVELDSSVLGKDHNEEIFVLIYVEEGDQTPIKVILCNNRIEVDAVLLDLGDKYKTIVTEYYREGRKPAPVMYEEGIQVAPTPLEKAMYNIRNAENRRQEAWTLANGPMRKAYYDYWSKQGVYPLTFPAVDVLDILSRPNAIGDITVAPVSMSFTDNGFRIRF